MSYAAVAVVGGLHCPAQSVEPSSEALFDRVANWKGDQLKK